VAKRSRKSDVERASEEAREHNRERLAALEDEWLSARLRLDVDAAAQLVDESYEGGTSDGAVHTKADFLSAIGASSGRFDEAAHSDRRIRIDGDVALSSGVARFQAGDRRHAFRYLRVYRLINDEWRLVASQSTRVANA